MAKDETVKSVRRIISDRAALLYGESGSGKTSTAILSCKEGDLCIVMTPQVFADGAAEVEKLKNQLRADQLAFADAVKMKAEQTKVGAIQQNVEKEDPDPELPMMAGTLSKVLKQYIRNEIPNYQSLEKFNGNVVLVVDEVGSHPLLVRALCRERSSIVSLVKDMLKVTGSVGLVVCGTGCESGDDSLGWVVPVDL